MYLFAIYKCIVNKYSIKSINKTINRSKICWYDIQIFLSVYKHNLYSTVS